MSSAGLPAPTAAQLEGEELYGDDFTAQQKIRPTEVAILARRG
jgi:hypothetical protein